MPTVNINSSGKIIEAQGIRNREEAGKRVLQSTGTADIPMSFFDHDYRIEDNETAGSTMNLAFNKHLSRADKFNVIPNFGADATLGTYSTLINQNTIIPETGRYFAPFIYKWYYTNGISSDIIVRSNYTSHGSLSYDAGSGVFTYNYPNIGNLLADGIGSIVYMFWVENSAAMTWADNIFIVNSGAIKARYGFFQVTGQLGADNITLISYPLTSQPVADRLFNINDNLFFEDGLALPGANFAGNHAIIYDLGYVFKLKSAISDVHILDITGADPTGGFNPIKSYNSTTLMKNNVPTPLNDGLTVWYDQTIPSIDNKYATVAFLTPICNQINFTISGFYRVKRVAGGILPFSVEVQTNPVGMTQYFPLETLNYYNSYPFVWDNALPISDTRVFDVRYNFNVNTRGIPIFLCRLYSNNNAMPPFLGGGDLYGQFANGAPTPTSVTLNSIDCRRRI